MNILLSALQGLADQSAEGAGPAGLGNLSASCFEPIDWDKVRRGLVALELSLETMGAFDAATAGGVLSRVAARTEMLEVPPHDNLWRAATGAAKALDCLKIAHRIATRAGSMGPHSPQPDPAQLAKNMELLADRVAQLEAAAGAGGGETVASDPPAK